MPHKKTGFKNKKKKTLPSAFLGHSAKFDMPCAHLGALGKEAWIGNQLDFFWRRPTQSPKLEKKVGPIGQP
jgi:hypothetical protein